eukprot:gene19238-25865_t
MEQLRRKFVANSSQMEQLCCKWSNFVANSLQIEGHGSTSPPAGTDPILQGVWRAFSPRWEFGGHSALAGVFGAGDKDVVKESDIQLDMAVKTLLAIDSAGEKDVVKESDIQLAMALKTVLAIGRNVMEKIVSRLLASIILNKAARHVEKVTKDGILKEKEAHPYIVEIDHALHHLEKDSNRDV